MTISRMQDHELYRRILGIEAPWYVDSVELKLEVGEIHVRLAHHDMIDWPCPECGAACKLYDRQSVRADARERGECPRRLGGRVARRLRPTQKVTRLSTQTPPNEGSGSHRGSDHDASGPQGSRRRNW